MIRIITNAIIAINFLTTRAKLPFLTPLGSWWTKWAHHPRTVFSIRKWSAGVVYGVRSQQTRYEVMNLVCYENEPSSTSSGVARGLN